MYIIIYICESKLKVWIRHLGPRHVPYPGSKMQLILTVTYEWPWKDPYLIVDLHPSI